MFFRNRFVVVGACQKTLRAQRLQENPNFRKALGSHVSPESPLDARTIGKSAIAPMCSHGPCRTDLGPCRVRVGLSLLLAAACPGRRHGSVLLRLWAHGIRVRFEGSDVVNLVPCDPALMLCVCPLVCVCMWCGSVDRFREVLMSCCLKVNVVLLSLVCVLQCARFRMRVLVGGGKA